MYKITFIIIIFAVFLAPLSAQRTYPLRTDTSKVKLHLTAVNGQLEFALAINDNAGFLPITGISIDDADLSITYEPKGLEKGFYPQFALHVIDATGRIFYPKPRQLKNATPPSGAGLAPVIWQDMLEEVLKPGLSYELVIQKTIMGPFDCDAPRPDFTLQQQLPHYAGAVVGLAAIGLGQVYRAQKEDAYDTYNDYWSNENTKEEADVFLNRATNKEKAAKTATYIGVAILGIDALTYAYRHIQIKKKQRIYDKHCTPQKTSLQWQPYWDPATPGSAIGAIVRFTF